MLDWQTAAAVFPGQGSQAQGMGVDFIQRFPIARDTFHEADSLLGYSLSRICRDDPAALNQTQHTQPALYVCSLAIWRVLRHELPAAEPAWMAGHSLGEFTALTAAHALPFESGLRLVRQRGELMQRAGDEQPGAMAAILGLDAATVETLCGDVTRQSGLPVVLANDNCPGQAVVSGDSDAVDLLITRAKVAGAKRAVKLAVSVAAHSPLMASAAADFSRAIDAAAFNAPNRAVIGNVNAQKLDSVSDIRDELKLQLTGAVRWTDSMRHIIDAGAATIVEIGAGNVLTGLMRRIDRRIKRINLNSVAAFDAFLESQA